MKKLYYFTSEYVSPGHPDAMANIIADTILDDLVKNNPNARVGLEVQLAGKNIHIAGEVKTNNLGDTNFRYCVKQAMERIGYKKSYKFSRKYAINSEIADVLLHITGQSEDISRGVDKEKNIGAGDQGIFFGYADNMTPDFMGLEHYIARELNYRWYKYAQIRTNPFGLDIKTQITIAYKDREMREPVKIDSIVVAVPTLPYSGDLQEELYNRTITYLKRILKIELPQFKYLTNTLKESKFFLNNTGAYHKHSSMADAGVVGRKIVVFSFGGKAPVGGGAFAGKDLSKSDVSMLYLARYLAKNIVASGLSDKATIQLSSAIGYEKPLSLHIDLHGTGKIKEVKLGGFILNDIDLSVGNLVNKFACDDMASCNFFGHFGKHQSDKNWEKLDLVEKFKELL